MHEVIEKFEGELYEENARTITWIFPEVRLARKAYEYLDAHYPTDRFSHSQDTVTKYKD